MPMIAFIGVRISWLMFARKSLFARVASSATMRARCSSAWRASSAAPWRCRLSRSSATERARSPVSLGRSVCGTGASSRPWAMVSTARRTRAAGRRIDRAMIQEDSSVSPSPPTSRAMERVVWRATKVRMSRDAASAPFSLVAAMAAISRSACRVTSSSTPPSMKTRASSRSPRRISSAASPAMPSMRASRASNSSRRCSFSRRTTVGRSCFVARRSWLRLASSSSRSWSRVSSSRASPALCRVSTRCASWISASLARDTPTTSSACSCSKSRLNWC